MTGLLDVVERMMMVEYSQIKSLVFLWLLTAAVGAMGANSALLPREKLENDSYDWYERHARVLREAKGMNPEIVFIGDSITHFWAGRDSLGGADASANWKKHFGRWRTLDLGYGWDRTQNVLWRIDHGELDGIDPKIVLITIGTNNIGETPHAPANTAEEIAEGVSAVVDRVRARLPRAQIVLCNILPRGRTPREIWRTKAMAANALLKTQFAAVRNVTWIEPYDAFLAPDKTIARDVMGDATHPTEKGYDIWAAALLPVFERLMAMPTVRPRPSAQLKARLDSGLEVYGILHFSVNTFTDREWGYGNESPQVFAPAAFDADQIVQACTAGGLQGLIVVAKHHDGFCLWRTKTTPHNIAASPFRGGQGDVVKELSEACARGGIRFGVYVSPWDRNAAGYARDSYRNMYWNQVGELLDGAYGPVFELWFDGANGGDGYYGGACERRTIPKNYYDFAGLIARSLVEQPQMAVFYDWDEGDLHYPRNEKGELHPDARCTFPARSDRPTPDWEDCLYKGDINGSLFKQPECDFPLRPGWFYHSSQDGLTKSGEYLMKVYLRTVGNGGTMNIGIAPDRRGLVTDEDRASLQRFMKVRSEFFAHRVTSAAEPFNVVVLKEDVSDGEQVDGWTLTLDGRMLQRGASVGVKRIRILDKMVSGKVLRFVVTAGRARPDSVGVELYRVDPGLVAEVLAADVPTRVASAGLGLGR